MPLLDQINSDLIQAVKGGDELTRDTLRMVKTAIKNKEISKGQPLQDEEIVEILSKEVKQRQEAAASFAAAQRTELAAKEENEITIIKKYLPQQLSEEEIRGLVKNAIAQTSAQTASDMGKVMASLMPQTKGKADGSLVSQIVKEQLNTN